MDLLRERDELRAAVLAKDTVIAVKEATILLRDATDSELLAEMKEMRKELQRAERHVAAARQAYEGMKGRLFELLDTVIPHDATVLMVSRGDDALLQVAGRRVRHFPQTADGAWNGQPADSQDAIDRLEAIRANGTAYLVLPEPVFWWLDHYAALATYLQERCRTVVHEDDTAAVFELSGSAG
jgi:hypothetical protein